MQLVAEGGDQFLGGSEVGLTDEDLSLPAPASALFS